MFGGVLISCYSYSKTARQVKAKLALNLWFWKIQWARSAGYLFQLLRFLFPAIVGTGTLTLLGEMVVG